MKEIVNDIRMKVTGCLVLLFLFGFTEPANATWLMIHGSGASIEDTDNPAVVTSYTRKGGGLEVKLDLGTSTWVHFAVPTETEPRYCTRYLKIRVNMLNDFCQCSGISQIRVYDGETLIKTFNTGWNTPGWQDISLDLGKKTAFSKGLGISVNIYTGPNGGYDSFVFSGAGADFIKK
jgi:hypothetical protein